MLKGFSTADKLYIRQDEAEDRPNAEEQINNPDSLYSEVKKLIKIRRTHPSLQNKGNIEFVYAEKNTYPLAYLRSSEKEKILVIINPADRKVSFDSTLSPKEIIYSFGGDIKAENGKITVPPEFAGFYSI